MIIVLTLILWLCACAVAFQKKQPGMKDTIDQVTTTDNRIVFFQRIAETSIFLGNQSIDTKRESLAVEHCHSSQISIICL